MRRRRRTAAANRMPLRFDGALQRISRAGSQSSKPRRGRFDARLGASSMKRWRRCRADRAIARSTPSSIGSAAKSCSSAIPPIPRRPKTPSRPPSPSRREQGARSFEPARRARARQALPIDRPPRRRPRRPRARARRLFADAGNAGDRRGAGAARGAGGDRRGQGASRAAAATDAVARRLRQRALRGARLRRAGNDGSLRQSPRVGVWRQGRARTIGGRLRLMGRQLRARRVAIDAGARRGLPQRRRGETRFARGRRRPSRRRDHLLVRRRVSRGAGSLGTRARPVPTRPRRRSGLSLRTGPRRRRDGLSGDCVMASRRGRSRGFAHRAHADADRGPHPCRHARAWKNATRPCSN